MSDTSFVTIIRVKIKRGGLYRHTERGLYENSAKFDVVTLK